ncbi:MAG: peptidylprolyl isomerase [Methylococcales bacterium]|nr:peptidylprolyl isomerase [Methylococcales bacterium]
MSLWISLIALLWFHVASADDLTIVARSGDQVVTIDEVRQEVAYLQNTRGIRQKPTLETLQQLSQNMLTRKLIAADSLSQTLDLTPEGQFALQRARELELGQLVMTQLAQVLPDAGQQDILAKEYFLLHQAEFSQPEQRRLSHILIRVEGSDDAEALTEAKALYQQLRQTPEQFEALAKSRSADPNSAQKGGDLGFGPKSRYVPSFADVAFALKEPGQLSQPVKTQFGYHLIRLDAIKPGVMPEYEAVRDDVLQKALKAYQKNRQEQYLNNIRASGKRQLHKSSLQVLFDEFYSGLQTP